MHVGLAVLDEGTAAVIDALQKQGVLLMEEKYAHKYPYDWRTKLPTIFRATDQASGKKSPKPPNPLFVSSTCVCEMHSLENGQLHEPVHLVSTQQSIEAIH